MRRTPQWAARLTIAFATAAGVTAAAAQSVPVETVNTMNKLWGEHPGYRANHAKGRVLEGTFTPTPEGKALSTAVLFQGAPVPVTVRFSDATGLPEIHDGAPTANPHGMAIKFHLPGGQDMDVVANSLQYFPVASGAEFLGLLQAVEASPPDAKKPTKLDDFMKAHPVVPKALATTHTPSSFAREIYFGIDAFVFVNADGKRQPFRFELVPGAGTDYLDAQAAGKNPPSYLVDEIGERLTKEPVSFGLVAQLAEKGDPTSDPTKPWASDRKLVNLGTIKIDRAVPDNDEAQKKLLFLPTALTPGIEMSDDRLPIARSQAYGVSFSRREGK